jgi:hypothetical protein
MYPTLVLRIGEHVLVIPVAHRGVHREPIAGCREGAHQVCETDDAEEPAGFE